MRTPRCALALTILLGAARGAADPPDLTLDLATVSPADGIVRWIYGADGIGNLGLPVAGGGDCDGDGVADYAVAFFRASPLSRSEAGEVDLVFGDGTTGGFVDTALQDPGILRIAGAHAREAAGSEIWMDDVTGDGIADLIVNRQNFSPFPDRPGAGALTILPGGPALRAHAETLEYLDLAAPPPADLPFLSLAGAGATDRLGIWARTGDVTGDGIADVVVGADQEDLAGEENRGAVYVIRGGPHLAQSARIDLRSFGATALAGHLARLTPPPGSAGYHFGATCQIADLDGNGRAEVLVAATILRGGASLPAPGAPAGSAESSGGAPHGALYVAWDDNFPAGPWPAGYSFDMGSPPASRTVIHGADANLYFGEEILGGRDYDGDGHADLFVGDLAGDGSPGADRPFSGIGQVFYHAAQLKGLEFDLDDPPAGLGLTTVLGPAEGAIGADTAVDGDFDGDGFADLMVASPHAAPAGRDNAGVLHVLFGRAGGWPALIDTRPGALPPAGEVRITEVWGATGTVAGDRGDTLGYSSAAADVDGDGLTDLLVNEMVGNGISPGTVDVGNLLVINGAALSRKVACVPGPTVLCLRDGRFQIEVDWRDFEDRRGPGRVVLGTRDAGLFWFFAASNWELLVKVLDGCGFNGHFWVFAAATTNVGYTLRVSDLGTGAVEEYSNPLGTASAAITDIEAFAACP